MTKNKQVKFLEQRVKDLEALIAAQKLIIETYKLLNPISTICVPYTSPTPICEHQYPNPWMATVPPHCVKCGQQAPQYNFHCGTYSNGVMPFKNDIKVDNVIY